MYLIYSVLLALAAVVSSPYWLIRGLKEKKYLQSLHQRIGWKIPVYPAAARPVWLHAVSVGEVLAAKSLFLALRKARPALPIVVSTVTATGQALARKEMPDAAAVFYFPFDWSACIRRFLGAFRPCGLVLLETELWPNLLRECAQRSIPVLLANGRISDKSIARYRLLGRFACSMMRNLTALGVQSPEDKRRFLRLGTPEGRIRITGNLKFDFPTPTLSPESGLLGLLSNTLRLSRNYPIVVVGSTMKGEEQLMIAAFSAVRAEFPAARLILAPRHPERFSEVAETLERSGLHYVRRSELRAGTDSEACVLLLDTIGELRIVYSLASVAVIGGSFLPTFGGHNPLEAAALGKAIVFGPYMSNFRDIARLFVKERAARQCSPGELPSALLELLRDSGVRQSLGLRAAATMRQNQGATANTVEFILPYLG